MWSSAEVWNRTPLLLIRGLFMVFLSLETPLVCSTYIPPQHHPSSFCSQTTSRRSCPILPTVDSVQIQQYLGRWFEIGSSAQFKFLSEAGIVCNQANYSLAGPPKPGQGAIVSVLNSGLPVIGLNATLGVRQISFGAIGVCSHARKVCTLLGSSNITQAVDRISEVSNEISSSHPKKASTLSHASSEIAASLRQAKPRLDSLSSSMSKIQLLNGRLNQAVGKVESNIEAVSGYLKLAMAEQRAIAELAKGIQAAKAEVEKVAAALKGDGTAARQLLLAAGWIDKELEGMKLRTKGIKRELRAMEAATAVIWKDRATRPAGGATYFQGRAVEDGKEAGKLEVTIGGSSGKYWIIGLEGRASEGYSGALVYSCEEEEEEEEIVETLFILSRNRYLSKATIHSFLSLAKSYGITTSACGNPFLFTLQRDGDCGTPSL